MKKITNHISRREFFRPFIASGIALGCYGPLGMLSACKREANYPRQFHISLSTESIEKYPDLPSIVHQAGITHAWIGTIHCGKFRNSREVIHKQVELIERLGMKAGIITVPLGHPADPIGFEEGPAARTVPAHWTNACTYSGESYTGTSIHSPAIEENAEALRQLNHDGYQAAFVDDEFRLARFPGSIGGCFCNECRNEFISKYGYDNGDWKDLIHSVENRVPSPVLVSWIEHIGDKLYNSFSNFQEAAPGIDLGIMVMYLGAEKAGISLDRYRNIPFRVGEFMFDDKSFGKLKGKTDELFSTLFHRRFVKPEKAFSETTIFPAKALSAKNMAAKLHITLISDIRNTMFMSGRNPIPFEYWEILAPVMKKSAQQHKVLAGHRLQGPFKHFWGWDSRIVGRDNPFSLFLASGIPFEVTDELSQDGWFFLSDEDALAVAEGRIKAKGENIVIRNSTKLKGKSFIGLDESLDEIIAFKKRIIPGLTDIPYVDGAVPVVFAWYPSVGKAVLWNVQENKQTFQIIKNGKNIQTVTVEGLDSELISC